jgi:hypothetical protein
MRTVTHEEKLKLTTVINEGIKILQDIDDLKEGLKDTVKNLAEEMDIKPALINKAIKAAYKRNLDEQRNTISEVEELLETIGKSGS